MLFTSYLLLSTFPAKCKLRQLTLRQGWEAASAWRTCLHFISGDVIRAWGMQRPEEGAGIPGAGVHGPAEAMVCVDTHGSCYY